MVHILGLLLASNTISCADVAIKVQRAEAYPDLTPEARAEIVDILKYELPDVLGIVCEWDANAD